MLDYTNENLDLDEIVFENRNHEYGAYDLRKRYRERIRAAAAWASSGLLALALIPMLAQLGHSTADPNAATPPPERIIALAQPKPTDPDLPEPPPIPEPPAAAPASTAPAEVVAFNPPEVSELDPSDMPTQQDLENKALGNQTLDGPELGPENLPADLGVPNGKGQGEGVLEGTDEPQGPVTVAEQQPEPGYNYKKYVVEHLRYPPRAIETEVSGRVVVEFVVQTDGTIQDATIKTSLSPECDGEALRIISEMPAWQPGKQGGRPVAVRMAMPIWFTLR